MDIVIRALLYTALGFLAIHFGLAWSQGNTADMIGFLFFLYAAIRLLDRE